MEIIRFFKKTETQTFEQWQDKFIRDANALASKVIALDAEVPAIGTPQATTSGTEFDFTIPSWATQITVCLNGVSLSGTDNVLIQIGDSEGIETSGYLSTSASLTDAAAVQVTSSTAGFIIFNIVAAAVRHGSVQLTLMDSSTNEWVAQGVISRTDATRSITVSGSKSLSGVLTTVRVTRTGTNTFDAGKVNVRYS